MDELLSTNRYIKYIPITCIVTVIYLYRLIVVHPQRYISITYMSITYIYIIFHIIYIYIYILNNSQLPEDREQRETLSSDVRTLISHCKLVLPYGVEHSIDFLQTPL